MDSIQVVGTDDRARAWSYRWLGPTSAPLPWTATGAQYGIFLLVAGPLLAVSLVLAGSLALILLIPIVTVAVAITKVTSRAITRDLPLRHHLAVFAAEISGNRRPPPQETTIRRVLPDHVEMS